MKNNKHYPLIITIDGPAASGKSTIGRHLADYLNYLFFDTGVMYRAVTWIALQKNADLKNASEITEIAETSELDVRPPSQNDGRFCDILANGKDITWDIRKPAVDANVSLVSSYSGVRKVLTEQQRKIGRRGKVVMLGRDIGTVVLPEAGLKIYLDASPQIRAQRRHIEKIQRGEQSNQVQILEDMIERDRFDSTRQIAPLKPAEDAIVLSTDQMDIHQVLKKIIGLLEEDNGS
jgi:cytidylate kinase